MEQREMPTNTSPKAIIQYVTESGVGYQQTGGYSLLTADARCPTPNNLHQSSDSESFSTSRFSSAMPVPIATQARGLSATKQGMPVTWVSSSSMWRSSAPPPVIIIP